MPPGVPGASVDANEQAVVQAAQESKALSAAAAGAGQVGVDDRGFGFWLSQVRPGGPWDYKASFGPSVAGFGNFNYGATCNVLGLGLQGCQRGAGGAAYITAAMNVVAGKKWTGGPGNPIGSPATDGGIPVYGDQATPNENQSVVAGFG